MSYDADKKLSKADQDQINSITRAAQAGSISWKSANEQANAIRRQSGAASYVPQSWQPPGNQLNRGNYTGGAPVSTAAPYKGGTPAMTQLSSAAPTLAGGGKTDYAAQLIQLMNGGNTDANYLQNLLNQRVNKALTTKGYEKFAYDNLYNQTSQYIQNLMEQQRRAKQPQLPGTVLPQMQGIANNLANTNFSDFQNGDIYAALKNQYAINGGKAGTDILGQASARTGGLASSYASQAANETYDDWMDKLQAAALEMYRQDRADQLNTLNALQNVYSDQYGQYQDQLNQYNQDRSYDRGVYEDDRNSNRSDYENDRDYSYQAGRDSIDDSRYNREYKDSRADTAYEKNLKKAEELAQYGDFSGYRALGYTNAQISNMKSQWSKQQALSAISGSASGSPSRRSYSSRGSSKARGSSASRKSTSSYGSSGGRITSAALGSSSWCAAVYNNMKSGGYRTATDYLNSNYKKLGMTAGMVGQYAKKVAAWSKQNARNTANAARRVNDSAVKATAKGYGNLSPAGKNLYNQFQGSALTISNKKAMAKEAVKAKKISRNEYAFLAAMYW